MVFLMKVNLLFSAALAQLVSPVLWGNRGLLWSGVAVRGGAWGWPGRVSLCTPGLWGYLADAVAGHGAGSCLFSCLFGCLQKGLGQLFASLSLEPG